MKEMKVDAIVMLFLLDCPIDNAKILCSNSSSSSLWEILSTLHCYKYTGGHNRNGSKNFTENGGSCFTSLSS